MATFGSLSDRLTDTFQAHAVRRGRHGARDPPRAARRGCRPRRRQGLHGKGARARPVGRGQQGAQPGPAGRADRQRGARRHPRRPAAPAAVRQEAADGHHARRSAGCGQDHARGQARQVAGEGRAHPAAGRSRPPAPERREPAPDRRRAGRRPGVRAGARQRHRQPGQGRQGRAEVRRDQAVRHGRHRHGRPARRRRRAHEAGGRHPQGDGARRSPVRDRRHDRSGRGRDGQGVPRRRGLHGCRALQARRRCAWWCRPLGGLDHRPSDHLRLHR